MGVFIKSDGVLELVSANLRAAPSWLPKIYKRHMEPLGNTVKENMEFAVEPHTYTDALISSVHAEYVDSKNEVRIEPRAMRGGWDAGTLLELGTRPHRAPWAPIAAYAEFRGVPAGPIWHAIATRGTRPHPFLMKTLRLSMGAINKAQRDIVADAAQAALRDTGARSAGIVQAGAGGGAQLPLL